jgi:hypothetical protein
MKMTIKTQHFADTFAIFSAIEQHTGARALVLFQIPALIDLALSTPHSDTSEGIRFVV